MSSILLNSQSALDHCLSTNPQLVPLITVCGSLDPAPKLHVGHDRHIIPHHQTPQWPPQ